MNINNWTRLGLMAGVGALVLTACGGTNDDSSPASPSPTDTAAESLDLSRWMEQIFASSPDTTLGEIIIPGTHDSGAYGIDVDAPCDSVPIAAASEGLVNLTSQNPCTAAEMYKAQNLDLRAQLDGGIRYLDLRVSIPRDVPLVTDPAAEMPGPDVEVPLVLEHFFSSVPLATGLADILAFSTQNPREQVIVDFQHIDLPEEANQSYYYEAVSQMLQTFSAANSPSVCDLAWDAGIVGATPATLATAVTLGQAWEVGRSLVVLVPEDSLPANDCYFPRADAIISPWPDTQDPAESTAANLAYLTDRKARLASNPPNCSNLRADADQGDNWCGFFVNQMQLTFQGPTFVECINAGGPSCSLYEYSQQVNNSVPGQISQWVDEGFPVNIVIVDFFEDSQPSYAETLVELNRARV